MTNTVVIYHSGYGHTAHLATTVAEGASAELIAIDAEGNVPDGTWEKLLAADAIIFGSPTYMGMVSWQFKKFADQSAGAWSTSAWKDKVFGGFTNSAAFNGDKLSTLHYFITLAAQHGGVWVSTGMLPAITKATVRDDLNYLGSFVGVMAQSPSDASPAEMSAGDLEMGRLYGVRVAQIASRFKPA